MVPPRRSRLAPSTAGASGPPPPPRDQLSACHRPISPSYISISDGPWIRSALAAKEALRRTERRDPAAARAVSGAARRLIDEREQAVCDLVAAAAKQVRAFLVR